MGECISAYLKEFRKKLQDKKCIGISNQCSFLSDKTPRPPKKDFLGESILKYVRLLKLHLKKYQNLTLSLFLNRCCSNS